MKQYTTDQILLAAKIAQVPLSDAREIIAKLDSAVAEEKQNETDILLSEQENLPLGKLKLGCE